MIQIKNHDEDVFSMRFNDGISNLRGAALKTTYAPKVEKVPSWIDLMVFPTVGRLSVGFDSKQ